MNATDLDSSVRSTARQHDNVILLASHLTEHLRNALRCPESEASVIAMHCVRGIQLLLGGERFSRRRDFYVPAIDGGHPAQALMRRAAIRASAGPGPWGREVIARLSVEHDCSRRTVRRALQG